ncbi:MAG TPA: PEP-CTERM sorting domain-containing protein [Gemmataceae bacterium]|jgi:hypothetical protein
MRPVLACRTVAVFVTVLAFGTPARGQPVVITFGALTHAGNGFDFIPSPYDESGYRFTMALQRLVVWETNSPSYSGSAAVTTENPSDTFTLTRAGGGEFALTAIDLGQVYPGSRPAFTLSFTGTRPDNSTATQSFTVPAGTGGPPVMTRFTFGPAFGDVISVQWSQAFPYHQFDNVAVSGITPVPEPGTFALAAGGAVALRLSRRRTRPAA